ncbi:MAG TPA: DUF1572 family protein [Gemmatimonadaceae bacterium]
MNDFVGEYDRYRQLGEKAMAQVSDEGLNRIVAPDGNSIAMIVRHIHGNLVSRFTDFLTSDGEKPSRDRDSEFAEGAFPRATTDSAWKHAFEVVSTELDRVHETDLTRTITIRGVELTVHEALCRSVAHTAYHVGQIVLLARVVATDEWQTLSIPRGQSNQYNANPTREKSPTQAGT